MIQLNSLKMRLLDRLDSFLNRGAFIIFYALAAGITGGPYVWLTGWDRDTGEAGPLFALLVAPVTLVLLVVLVVGRQLRDLPSRPATKLMWSIVAIAMVPILGNFASIYLRMAGFSKMADLSFWLRYVMVPITMIGIFLGQAIFWAMAKDTIVTLEPPAASPPSSPPPSTPPGSSTGGISRRPGGEQGSGPNSLDLNFVRA